MEDKPVFQHLIRFIDDEGKENYGYLPSNLPADKVEGNSVQVLLGDIRTGFSRTSAEKTVRKVQVPLPHLEYVTHLLALVSIANCTHHPLHWIELPASRN